jgi:uncharacterized protein YfdQ (DUF2303 family)
MNTTNDADTILGAGAALNEQIAAHGGIPYTALPSGYQVHDLERLLPNPTRKRANVVMHDTASFIEYVKKHGSMDTCTIYADIDQQESKATYIAVIDDHGADPGAAQWRSHTATLTPRQSVEWARWIGGDNSGMSQAEFAAWIEDNLQDIAGTQGAPTGAEMLQMALNFERNATKRYKQKLDLQGGGIQFEYIDDEDKDTRTQMKVFERFGLGMRVFVNGDAYAMQARLKYRESGGKLSFWYELIRPDKVFEAASNDIVKAIREGTGMMVLIGNPMLDTK